MYIHINRSTLKFIYRTIFKYEEMYLTYRNILQYIEMFRRMHIGMLKVVKQCEEIYGNVENILKYKEWYRNEQKYMQMC